jgi:hypothetical protein
MSRHRQPLRYSPRVTLEDQLAALAELGITLDPGITIDDLLYSFDRHAYEMIPFRRLLYILGAEVERAPRGRAFCSRAWNFDTECITGDGSYVRIARQLCRVAGRPNALGELRDKVSAHEAWIKYSVDGASRHWPIELTDDWADMLVVSYLMNDLERDGMKFRARDNGQAMVLYYLDDAQTRRLRQLSGQEITTVVP